MKLPLKVKDEGDAGHALVDADGWELVRFEGDALAEYLSRMLADADRLAKIHSHLCGYIENGGGEPVTFMQDDATRDWIVRVGPALSPRARRYSSPAFRIALDLAINEEGGKS